MLKAMHADLDATACPQHLTENFLKSAVTIIFNYAQQFPFFAFTPRVIPFRTSLVILQCLYNITQNIPDNFQDLPRIADSLIAITTPEQARTTAAVYTDAVTSA